MSKPGPRFALVAGTLTVTERPRRLGGRALRQARRAAAAARPSTSAIAVDVDGHDRRLHVAAVGGAQRPLRVLEAVAGHGEHDGRARPG